MRISLQPREFASAFNFTYRNTLVWSTHKLYGTPRYSVTQIVMNIYHIVYESFFGNGAAREKSV